MSRITVFGAGAWGSTLAQVLCDAGNDVLLWGRNVETVQRSIDRIPMIVI